MSKRKSLKSINSLFTVMGSEDILFDNFHHIILASTDPAVIETQYQQALNKIISTLITGDGASMTDTFWTAIVDPCKLIAGVGVLFWLIPIVPDLSFDNLKNHLLRILTLLLITFMFAGNAYGARIFALGNYALIKGIDSQISSNTKMLGSVNAEIAAIKTDNETVKAISNQVQTCIKLPKTIVDPDPSKPGNLIPNPTYIQCNKDVQTMITAAKISVTNADLAAQLAKAESDAASATAGFDFGKVWDELVKSFNDLDKWIGTSIIGAIMDGWSVMIGEIADEGFILSILALPIPLAFSFMTTKPLEIWFASLWGLGFFKFSLTILGAFLGFINASTSGSQPAFALQLGYAVGAPIVAGVIARGGGAGVYELIAQVSTEIVGFMKLSKK
jgi:hypothetical protein